MGGNPHVRRAILVLIAVVLVGVAAPLWLPLLGTTLAVEDSLQPADVALVLEGTGASATDAAEAWRQQGLVRDVVIVEAPVRTHALIAYWSDFVRWGLAAPAPTPADHLRDVRAPSTQAGQQANAALPALQADNAHTVLVLGGGGIGSRLVAQQLATVFRSAGISLYMVRYGTEVTRDPSRWFQNAEDRRAVLDSWLQLIVPFLGDYEPGT